MRAYKWQSGYYFIDPTYGTTGLPPKGGSRCVLLSEGHYMPLSEIMALPKTKKERQREDKIGEKAIISNTILSFDFF